MTADIRYIETPNWQMSPDEFGAVLTDEQDIYRCIHNIIFTRKGDLAMQYEFGSDVLNYLDKPVNSVKAKIVNAVIEAVDLWEPRIKVNSVDIIEISDNSNITFIMKLTVIGTSKQFTYKLNLDAQGGSYGRSFSDEFDENFS